MSGQMRARLGLLVGAVLALPAVRLWMHGQLPLGSTAIRVGLAMGLGMVAVAGFAALIGSYVPAAKPARDDDITDAELVEGPPVLPAPNPIEREA